MKNNTYVCNTMNHHALHIIECLSLHFSTENFTHWIEIEIRGRYADLSNLQCELCPNQVKFHVQNVISKHMLDFINPSPDALVVVT